MPGERSNQKEKVEAEHDVSAEHGTRRGQDQFSDVLPALFLLRLRQARHVCFFFVHDVHETIPNRALNVEREEDMENSAHNGPNEEQLDRMLAHVFIWRQTT
jgi:hypothetical protein